MYGPSDMEAGEACHRAMLQPNQGSLANQLRSNDGSTVLENCISWDVN